jgi:hypothetical protein
MPDADNQYILIASPRGDDPVILPFRRTGFLLLLLFLSISEASFCEGAVIYRVSREDATGPRDGSSWERALDEDGFVAKLAEEGLTDAEFWVAKGFYRPTGGADRGSSFVLRKMVALYGGFEGNEEEREQRDPVENETILSGNILGGNSYHVVRFTEDADETTVLDGFLITGGRAADALVTNKRGGGIYNDGGSPVISNCIVKANRATSNGGGMYSKKGSPVLSGCIFEENTVEDGFGGALFSQEDELRLRNCAFRKNRATNGGGGGVCLQSSVAVIDACELYFNRASNDGGGALFNRSGSLLLTNCSFSSNMVEGGSGGAVHNEQSGAVVVNCTFAENSCISSSGAFYNKSGDSVVANSVFSGNGAAACVSGRQRRTDEDACSGSGKSCDRCGLSCGGA